MTIEQLIAENDRRNAVKHAAYNPLTGEGAPLERRLLEIADYALPSQWVPVAMFDNLLIQRLAECGSIKRFCSKYLKVPFSAEIKEKVVRQIIRVRNKHDFFFWAYSFVKIKTKEGGDDMPFMLRLPQRRLVESMEQMRMAGKPVRVILLKARQWGGSTAVQIYMAWIQLCHQKGWNSIIVGHINASSLEVKGMFTKLMKSYPSWLLHEETEVWDPKEKSIRPFEGSTSIDLIPARNCKIKTGTAENPEGARGGDSAMAHCTEVAFWRKTDKKTPSQIVKSVCGGLLQTPLSLKIFESTANGTGNFFHKEWQRAKRGESDMKPIFVPWFEINMYELPIDNHAKFAQNLLDNYENEENNGKYNWQLWQWGATLEAINWYITERKAHTDHADMASEYPSDDIEAFKHSGKRVFDPYKCEALRVTCKPPRWIGDIYGDAAEGHDALKNPRFIEDKQGILHVWALPDKSLNVKDRYITIVDIGGRSDKADYSDILVLDRYWMMDGERPEVVAEWHGHIDMDLLAWKSAQVAAFYNNSLLVIESNTLETHDNERDTDGDNSGYILKQIAKYYRNLYAREQSPEDIKACKPRKWGFHTNTSTKPMIIANLVKMIREGTYIERETEAIDEYLCYEKKPNGSYGAIVDKNDDRLMTRAIGLKICFDSMPLPRIVEERRASTSSQRALSAATI